jgi:Family of unknown function (DUF6516)
MNAELITRFKDVTPEGNIIEWVIWRIQNPLKPSSHDFKYRAAYIVSGVRVIGFDNERGKGDHCHIDGVEKPYQFTGVDQLVEDFLAEIEHWRTS